MGPTNVALVKYFKADQQFREAKARLDAASKDVRVQERRVADLTEKQKTAQLRLRESQSKAGQLELDLKSRDAHIEKLRTQQASAKNNKEYQTFLIEINTSKVDRNKIEDDTMKLLEGVERGTKELAETSGMLESEKSKAGALKEQIGGRVAELQAEIDAIKPGVEQAATAVPAKVREVFEKLNDRLDGEALAAIQKPDRRREEYICSACNMELVVDVYNKLHARDELVFCPSCRRILYIPDDLPPEVAVKNKPTTKRSDGQILESGKTVPSKTRKLSGSRKEVDELTKVLIKAQGESVRNAVAAGNQPVECEIRLAGRLVGTFKGQNVENLTRTAKFCLNEAGIGGELVVSEKKAKPVESPVAPSEETEAAAIGASEPTPAVAESNDLAEPVGESAEPVAESVSESVAESVNESSTDDVVHQAHEVH